MRLKNCDLLPGCVTDIDDPKRMCRIKAVIPGEMDSQNQDKDLLPWISPLTGGQTIAVPKVGETVWVLKNNENVDEYWYIMMYNPTAATMDYMSGNYSEDTQVVMQKDNGASSASITYDSKNGYNIKTGNNTALKMSDDGSVDIKTKNGSVKMTGEDMVIDSGEEPAVLGNKLCDVLEQLSQDLQELGTICAGHTFLLPLAAKFVTTSTALSIGLYDILSEHIKLK